MTSYAVKDSQKHKQEQLEELKRNYKLISNNSRVYTDEAQNKIKKQRKQIDNLKKDNQSLREELAQVQQGGERTIKTA